ncbi:MAG: cadherin-like beta sandwich domain-containing protein [Acidimicrobiia bacterium]
MNVSRSATSSSVRVLIALALVAGVVVSVAAPASAAALTFTNRTTADGLGHNSVRGVAVDGSTVYAATQSGLSISTNGGTSFTNRTTTNGLGNNEQNGVAVSGSTVYAATVGGLSISTNGGASFTNRTTANGLGHNFVYAVTVVGSTVYAGTQGGLSISYDGGASFTNRTTDNGLAHNSVYSVAVSGSNVYAATSFGLSISTNGGWSFTNRTTANGLAFNFVNGVAVSGSSVYASSKDGLSISTDGGVSFTNRTTANGLGSNSLASVVVSGSNVYAATGGGLSISTDGGASFTNYTTADGLSRNFVTRVAVSGSTVYASDGGAGNTHPSGLNISVTPSSVATLSDLSLSTGTLSPSFDSATTSYTASVSNVTSSMTVTPTATDAGATITVNGVATASGSASASIPLSVGTNTITVVVTAADGTTISTYTTVVTRAAAETMAPVGSGVASPAAVVNGTVTLSPGSGTSASTSFALALNGGSSCPGDGAAGYSWQTFLIDSSVDLQTVQFDSTGPVPSLPGDAGKYSKALFDTSSVKVLAQTPQAGTGTIAPIPTMSFAGNLPVADGTYHVGIACTSGTPGTSQLKSLWSGVVTFSNSGTEWNQNTGFTPMTPKRVYDTRDYEAQGLREVTKQRVGPDAPVCVAIAGVGGVPTTATAVSLNVVATENDAAGFLTVYPGGMSRPGTASVNYVANDIASNAVITGLDSSGVACVHSMVSAHVVVDVTGWFPRGSSFTAVTPVRAIDTRAGETPGVRPVATDKVGPTNTLEVKLTDLGSTVPASGVGAVAVNVTVTEPDSAGFVTVWACGTRPDTSSVNYAAGQIIPNLVITQVSATGTACFHSSTNAHVVVDVVGWFASTGSYTAIAPARMADSRDGASGLRPFAVRKLNPISYAPTINFFSVGSLPGNVRAVVLVITVDQTEGPGFITAYPAGARPYTSSLNYKESGLTRSNTVVMCPSASGDVSFYSMTSTHLIIDVVGYFT